MKNAFIKQCEICKYYPVDCDPVCVRCIEYSKFELSDNYIIEKEKKMDCEKCIYYYEIEINKEKQRYNALSDRYYSDIEKGISPACGFNPGGVLLDKEAPICHEFKRRKK